MSGHSKWHRIKHQKAAADSRRGQSFTRLAKQISVAARANPNPDQNPLLRQAINLAKQANMPQANIDHLLKKSSAAARTITYAAFSRHGVALLIIASTDNHQRTVAEIRHILNQHGATLSQPHSVLWKFNQSSAGQFTARFPQPIAPAEQPPLAALIKELLEHPDVQSVYTDAAAQ